MKHYLNTGLPLLICRYRIFWLGRIIKNSHNENYPKCLQNHQEPHNGTVAKRHNSCWSLLLCCWCLHTLKATCI